MTSLTEAKTKYNFLIAGGEMGALMRAKDWSKTPLGSPDSWPQSLRTAVSILLNSRYPMFLFWGPQLIKIYNDGYRPITGDKHPAVLGRPGPEVWPEIWDDIGPMVEKVMRHGESTWSDDLPLFMRRHGFPEEVFFTFSYSPIRDESGGIGGMFCACTETTIKVQGERRLKLLRDLATASGQARSVQMACTLSAKVLANNAADVPFALVYLFENGAPALVASAGIDAQDVPGVWPLDAPIEVNGLQAYFKRIPAGPWPEAPSSAMVLPLIDHVHDRPSGAVVLGISSRIRFDEAYRGFFDLVAGQLATSIANARASEEERRRAEALAELDRAKTQFFSNVSHEFRTPLTLMLGPLEDTLAADDTLSAESREHLQVAHRNSLRLLKLVNTLLDFSRIEAGRMNVSYEAVDLAAFTADLASVFRSAVERAGVRLLVQCPPLPQPVYVDREMWEKIVFNLLSNAFKFTFEGEIEVSLRAEGEYAVLTVRDTGIGIPADELPRVFERFHRVKGARGRSFEGSGIGLALVQELAKLHGGEARVESEPNHGSIFSIAVPFGSSHLPRERIEVSHQFASTGVPSQAYLEEVSSWHTPAVEPVAAAASATSAPARVLVADDNADMREYLRRFLSEHYDVQVVADGNAALAAARERAPDLILTDMMMPNLDGYGLLSAVRADETLKTLPVILLSARAGEEARVEGMNAGADDYLTKPFSARELLARVGAHLASARMRDEAARRERELTDEANKVRAQLELVLTGIGDQFGLFDRDFRYVYINDRAIQVTGKTKQEFLGKTPWELFPATVGSPFERALREVMASRKAVQFDYYYAPLQRWFENRFYPTPDGGVANFAADITERKQTEASLRESDAHLQLTTEAARVGAWQWNIETGEVVWSDMHKRLWGYESTTAPTYNDWADVIDARDLERVRQASRKCLEGTAEYDVEYRIKPRRANDERWVRSTGRAQFDSTGRAVSMSGVSMDITQRKRAEEALRKSELFSRAIIESSSDCIKTLSLDGRLLWISETGRRILNVCDVSEVVGKCWVDFWSEDQQPAARTAVRMAADGGVGNFIGHFPLNGAVRWWEVTITPMKDAGGEAEMLLAVSRDVTERKRVEETLRASEHQLRFITDHVPVYIVQCDAEERFTFVNAAYAGRYGLRPEQLIGKCVADVVGATAYESIRPHVRTVLRGERIDWEQKVPYDAFGTRWIQSTYVPQTDVSGAVIGFVAVIQDVTTRRAAEEAVRESEERFRRMADHAPVMVWVTEPNGRCSYLSKTWYEFTGQTPETGLEFGWLDAVHPDDRPEAERVFISSNQQHEPFRVDYRVRRKDGEYRWAIDSALPRFGAEGQYLGYIGSVIDITERKRIEEEREKFAFLAENSHDFIGMCDAYYMPFYINPNGLQLIGLDNLAQAQKIPVEEFFFPEDRAMVLKDFFPKVMANGHGEIEIRFRHFKTGQAVWMLYSVFMLHDAAGQFTGLVAISREITQRRQLEDNLRRMAAELSEADRRKDEFLATLSHELRNPLAPLRNSLHLLRVSGHGDTFTRPVYEMMERQVNYLVRLVDDLLEVSRISRGAFELRKEAVDVATVVRNAIETSHTMIEGRRHRLTVSLPPEPVWLDGDPVRLAQIVANLLNNAAKYTEPSGDIAVNVVALNDAVTISVRDNGSGIAPAALPRLFEMFNRGHRAGQHTEGLGIGLALAQRLAQMHGGKITARSDGIGKGSEFVVRLPIGKQQGAQPLAAVSADTSMPRRQILVVDDNRDAADSLCVLLGFLGADARVAYSGVEALTTLESYDASVVLLDLGMPGMDGYEVVRTMRERFAERRLAIAALTGWGQAEDRQRVEEAGFDYHLVKPAEMGALQSLLASIESNA